MNFLSKDIFSIVPEFVALRDMRDRGREAVLFLKSESV
jgi:hypothetical protein